MSVTEPPVTLSAKQRHSWREVAANLGIASRQISATYEIDGPLDVSRLRAALTAVVCRHEQLRLRVTGPPDAPVATLRPPPDSLPIPMVDLTGLDEARLSGLHMTYAEREAGAYLDLSRDWPVRALVLRRSSTDHLLLLSVHHLLCDGWGAGLIGRHLAHAYQHGDLSGIPQSEPYSVYVAGEAGRLASADYEKDLRWWAETLADHEPAPPLGTGEGPTMDTLEWHHPTPASFPETLRAIARPTRTSTYVVVVALVAAALQRRTGVRERVLLVSHMGPRLPDFEHTVGLFSNRLPLRVAVDPALPVRELVRAVKSGMLDLIDHAAPSYADLAAAVSDRQTVEAPLTLQYVPPQFVAAGEADPSWPVAFRFRRYRLVASALPLHLLLMEEPGGRMWWSSEFRTDYLRPGVAADLFHGTLSDVLALAARPGDPIADVPAAS